MLNSTRRRLRTVFYLFVLLTLAASKVHSRAESHDAKSQSERRHATFQEQRRKLLLNLRHEISELSRQCHEEGLLQAAKDLTAVSIDLTGPVADIQHSHLVQLPVSDRLPPEQQAWRQRLRTLREDRARDMYILARRCLHAQLPSLAYSIVQDVLRLDPDHKHSRSILGQQLFHDRTRADDPTYAGEWVSPFEAAKRSGSSPEVNHPVYGWIPASHVDRYEQGQRQWRGKWISAEKEAEIRRDFRNAWEVRSEHFLVTTNTSLEEGVAVSRKLERFYGWLTQNMAAFFDTPQALEEKFERAQATRRNLRTRAMDVHYYATREEYRRRLRGKIPPDRTTNGVYWEPDRTCYFFRNPEDPDHRTVFHEATHQILDLATKQHRLTAARRLKTLLRKPAVEPWRLCGQSNFWIIEGLACYFESFEISEGTVSVGRPDYIRFVGAKQRCLIDGFYVPLQGFMSLGHDDFMRHPNVAQFYTQASGVAHFLMHHDGGVYRDDLVKLLSAVYRPDLRDLRKQPSLQEISGVRFETLDVQYRSHLEQLE